MTAQYDLPVTPHLQFVQFQYQGVDAATFLQGQLTVNVDKLNAHYQATAICDLKGRIQFGLWVRRISDTLFELVISQDLSQDFQAHIRKYGAFSKVQLSQAQPVYPHWQADHSSFSSTPIEAEALEAWQKQCILQGDAWITQATAHIFQPQELRLHQRGGVDYDKGCYLGQEIIARLWFKAKPKHWLHLVTGQADAPRPADLMNDDVQVVNCVSDSTGQWWALVCAKPEALVDLHVQVLDLPEALNGAVGRQG